MATNILRAERPTAPAKPAILSAQIRPAVGPESLEPRITFSTDIGLGSLSAAGVLALALTGDADAFQVVHVGAGIGGEVVKVKNLASGLEQTFSGVKSILADGGAGDDLLDFSAGSLTSQVTFAGGDGLDTIVGPAGDTTWVIDGENAGSAGANIHFLQVENATGAVDNQDEFVFEQTGSLAGTVSGGAGGYDTVVLNGFYNRVGYEVTGAQSGNLTLDAQRVVFDGMEPIVLTNTAAVVTVDGTSGDDDLRLSADAAGKMKVTGSGETLIFNNPTSELIINGLGGSDEISINPLDPAFAAKLSIYGYDSAAVVTTTNTDKVTFLANLDTRGHNLTVIADEISVFAGKTLSTKGATTDGDIEFRARHIAIADLQNLSPIVVATKTAKITIGAGAKLLGGDISLGAQAEDRALTELLGTGNLAQQFIIGPLLDKVADLLALPVKVLIKDAVASVTLGAGVEIESSGSVGITATAAADSSGKATSQLFSIGYAQAGASATVDVGAGVKITAGGSVNITSEANTTAEMETKTSRTLPTLPGPKIAFSLAVAKASTTSHTTVASGAMIVGGDVVNIRALGAMETSAAAESGIFSDGSAGTAFAAEFSVSDIKTTVNGSVTAGAGNSNTELLFNPKETNPTALGYVDYTANTINFGPSVLETEDTLVYSNRGGQSIGGLVNGHTYYVIKPTDGSGLIQLADTEQNAIDGVAINLLGGLLAGDVEEEGFAASDVDAAADTISINGLGSAFALGQEVRYVKGSGAAIPGLVDGTTYYVIADTSESNLEGDSRFTTKQTFQLAATKAGALAGVNIDLGTPSTGATGYKLQALQSLDSGFAPLGIVSALETSDKADATAGIGTEDVAEPDAPFSWSSSIFDSILTGLSKSYADNQGSGNSGASGGLTVSGALSFVFTNHDVLTTIGADANLESADDLDVTSEITEVFQLGAESSSEPTSGTSTVSVAALIGLLNNDARTFVEPGADLDALGGMRITSSVTYPYVTRPDEYIPTSFGEVMDKIQDGGYDAVNDYLDGSLGLKSTLFNTWARSTAIAENMSIAGSVNFTKFDNVSMTTIGDGALINQDATLRGTADSQIVSIEAATQMQVLNVTGVFDFQFPSGSITPGSAEFDPKLSVSPVGSSGGKGGFGGAIYLSFLDNKTQAIVGEDVQIFTGEKGALTVTAEETNLSFNFAQAGGSAGKYGVGGSFSFVKQTSDTLAQISPGASIEGGPVTVYAGNLETQINWVGGVAKSSAIGVGASVAINDITRKTRAVIGDVASVDNPLLAPAGDRVTLDVAGDVKVSAKNDGALWAFSVAGALVSSSPAPETPEDRLNKLDQSGRSNNDDNTTDILLGLFADDLANYTPQKSATTGVGIAGAVSFNYTTDNVRAAVQKTDITADSLAVTSDNKTQITAATGGLAATSVQGGNNAVALAGALSVNELKANTYSFVRDADLDLTATSGGGLTVSARRGGNLFALAAGAGGAMANGNVPGASGGPQSAVSVAGSVSLNEMTGSTLAYVQDSTGETSGGASLSAADSSKILSVAGGLSVALAQGSTGSALAASFGIAGAGNNITNTVEARFTGSDIEETGAGNITVTASGTETIKAYSLAAAVAASSGLSGNGFAGAGGGSGSMNSVKSDVRALIESGSTIKTNTGDVRVVAVDDATIVADSGGFAVAASQAVSNSFSMAVGASFSQNVIKATAYADIAGSTVTAGDEVMLLAGGSSTINALTIAGAVSAGLGAGHGLGISAAGALAFNSIREDIQARVRNGSIITAGTGALTIGATDDTKIDADGGAIAAAIQLAGGNSFAGAVGASLGINNITNTASATIDGATVNAPAGLALAGISNAKIDTFTFGLAGTMAAGVNGGFGLAGTGAASTSRIRSTIEAIVRGSSTVTVGGAGASLLATDNALIAGDSGALAIAAAAGQNSVAFAVGVSAARNTVDNKVNAGIEASTFTITGTPGSLTILATENARILSTSRAASIAVGAGSSNGAGLAGGGAEAHNVILTDTHAYISGSTVTASGNVSISALSTSVINATVDTVVAGGAVGGNGAAAAAIGASVARNYIGYKADGTQETSETDAYILNSSVKPVGSLTLLAQADQTINANVLASSVAVAAGGTGGGAASGSGASAKNRIAEQVRAYADGNGAAGISASAITFTARDISKILSDVDSATLAASFAPDGAVAVAVGVALAENSIENEVAATIRNAGNLKSLTGGITLTAREEATITGALPSSQ